MSEAGKPAPPMPHVDYFQQLADGAPVMIWMAGMDLGCFYFNRAWLDFRGRTLEQEAGNGWAEGVHPEDLERCLNHYVGCFERRVAFAMSYRLLDRHGVHRWILDRGAPHSLPDGTFLGFFGGCAEIEIGAPIARHAELGASLARMKEFARDLAIEDAAAAHPPAPERGEHLRRLAQHAHEARQERQWKHAVGEMRQLVSDMAEFGGLLRGDHVP